jgi:hypothetical protein
MALNLVLWLVSACARQQRLTRNYGTCVFPSKLDAWPTLKAVLGQNGWLAGCCWPAYPLSESVYPVLSQQDVLSLCQLNSDQPPPSKTLALVTDTESYLYLQQSSQA